MAARLLANVRERGLGCGLGCTPAVAVTHRAAAAAVCDLCRYVSAMSAFLPLAL